MHSSAKECIICLMWCSFKILLFNINRCFLGGGAAQGKDEPDRGRQRQPYTLRNSELFLDPYIRRIFFFVFLMAFIVYFLYESKLKPGVSVVMSATPSRKGYYIENLKGSY